MSEISRQRLKNLNENLLPTVNDAFIRAGGYGGSQNNEYLSRALRDTQESILGEQSKVMQDSYNQAMTTYQGAQNRALSGGQALGNLGQMTSDLGGQEIAR